MHTPVMLDEVITTLAPPPGGRAIDATIDGGGHAHALLQHLGVGGSVLGLDRDPAIVEALRQDAADEIHCGRLHLVATSFADIGDVAARAGFLDSDAVLFDLGISSYHLEASGRGFSFERDEPLDLRFDPTDPTLKPASQLLQHLRTDTLAGIIATYGEERYARRIARHIERARHTQPLATASALRDCILQALPPPARRLGNRSVARVFQALRITTNGELDALERALPQIPPLLRPGGRVAIIAFHSLEDRLVKRFFRQAAAAGNLTILTKKPMRPSVDEVLRNPRARSARLRVAQRP